MYEYCSEENKESDLCGSDGVVYDTENNNYYLFAEHFKDEKVRIDVKYCPECGTCLTK
ncbi:hypothetical protein [Paenibacillus sp. FSL H3-0286]|uniref:hypothetical protein n=1 Tax=Paenibacillus sp. FSL H3-0286 TaxID=2921427 RepID=UPI00324E644E